MVPDLRSIAPAVASADGATGVPDGGSCYANTLNSGPTWSASQANLRDHALRLSKRRGDIACAEVATANAKLGIRRQNFLRPTSRRIFARVSGVNDGETNRANATSTVPLIEKSPTTGSLRSQSRAKDPAWLGGMPQNIGGALGLNRNCLQRHQLGTREPGKTMW